MATVLHAADKPAVCIDETATVTDAVRAMVEHEIGAVVIVAGRRAVGIFSYHDALAKVILGKRDPDATRLASVMTSPVVTIPEETSIEDALALMSERQIRHLPVAGEHGRILGMLSVRRLEHDQIDDLQNAVDALDAYASYDGATG